MARKAYTILGRVFPTKKLLEQEAKALRDRQPLGCALGEQDQAFVLEVFRQLYPGFEARVHPGVASMSVVWVEGGRCFRMLTHDGRVEEPSLRKAFSPSVGDPSTLAFKAFRYCAWLDCVQYRDRHFASRGVWLEGVQKAPCELSGVLVSVEDCEVDHQEPLTFKALLDGFLSASGLQLGGVLTQDLPHGRGSVLADSELAARWVQYHRERAKLRVLSRSVHVEITRLAGTGALTNGS